jgi:hypothetical protein
MGAHRPLVVCFLILLTAASWHPPAGRAAPQGDDSYVIVSMGPNGPGTYDVKLKNTRTGYIHSLTLIAEIALRFVIGALVKERREGGRVVLVPVGGPPARPEPRPEPRPQPPRDPLGFPPAYADTLPNPRTERNTARPSDNAPLIKLRLDANRYFVYQIRSIKVINADQRVTNHNPPLSAYRPGTGGCDVIANGSFTTTIPGKGSQLFPVVTVMRRGVVENNGLPKTWGRGGMAVLRDGTVTIDRQDGVEPNLPQNQIGIGLKRRIDEAFGERGNPVSDFMGGGALLIENGETVDTKDLYNRQGFDNGGRGITAEQFRQTDHTLVGILAGQAFLIIAHNVDGPTMQQDLFHAGVRSAVMFDGGGGFFWHDTGHDIEKANVLGFCVTKMR